VCQARIDEVVAVVVGVDLLRNGELAELGQALGLPRGLSCPGQGGEQNGDQQGDDGDDDEQFDEREGPAPCSALAGEGGRHVRHVQHRCRR
jgi:hypothetical protein